MWERILLALTLTMSLSLIAEASLFSNFKEAGEFHHDSESILVVTESKKSYHQ